jgi:DNA-binding transcriptional MerR regulator
MSTNLTTFVPVTLRVTQALTRSVRSTFSATLPAVLLVAVGLANAGMAAPSADAVPKPSAWKLPSAKDVRKQVFAWLDGRAVDAATRAKAEELFPANQEDLAGVELLSRVVRTVALADERARKLVDLCSQSPSPRPPEQSWLKDPKLPPVLARNLQLYYGIWLVRGSLFDEAMEQLSGLEPDQVADPASLFFYQGVIYHQLLNKDAGLKAIRELLEEPEQSPRRYAAVAKLMQEDLRQLKEDSLDHIARRMDDIRRRLGLGRGDQKVRKVEDGVIESLDKLIKKLEEQQQASSSSASSNSTKSSKPLPDSRIMGGKGPGEVAKKNIGDKDGWGNLPPKQREDDMQQIGREFPSHYRDVVEQYFRNLAGKNSGQEMNK